jgi:mannonate dehydratase
MEMTMRWFGADFDTVTLSQIRQVPGVKGVITTLYDKQAGELWEEHEVRKLIETVEASGLHISGIESVNIHDSIKIGTPDREQYIDNYIETLRNLGKCGIHMVCYNFMPVFDWTRTELARQCEDGSTVLAYNQDVIDALDLDNLYESMKANSNGHVLPGWEPERMADGKLMKLFDMYKDVDEEKLFENLKYFLQRIMPVCDEYDINMAIHPDDPAWSVYGLPRIITNQKNIERMMKMVDNPHNGVTFCSGSYGTNLENDMPAMIRALKGRIHFAHVRNLKFNSPRDFQEAPHLSSEGTFDMYEIMKALYDIGFDGPIRPDHGRTIWGETGHMPGYGLYDRALGATYLNGLWEAISKSHKEGA